MNPVLIIAIPLGLVILGMILNSWDLGFNQPPSSTEQDPVKRLTAEKESYRKFFDQQRSRSIKRQKRRTASLPARKESGISGRTASTL